jgi:hypothetical protein
MKNLTTSKKHTNSRSILTLSPAIKNSLCHKTKNVCLCNKHKIFLRHKQNVCLCNETGGKKGKKASHLGPLVRGRRWPVGLLYREGLLRKGAI